MESLGLVFPNQVVPSCQHFLLCLSALDLRAVVNSGEEKRLNIPLDGRLTFILGNEVGKGQTGRLFTSLCLSLILISFGDGFDPSHHHRDACFPVVFYLPAEVPSQLRPEAGYLSR